MQVMFSKEENVKFPWLHCYEEILALLQNWGKKKSANVKIETNTEADSAFILAKREGKDTGGR